MATINSEAVGRGSGSAGNITYRYTRGKTIMSRRITSNKSNTLPQIEQRKGFGTVAHVAKALRSLLEIGFSKHKNSRADNLFMHYNTSLMAYIRESPDFDVELPSITNLCIALSNPHFAGKILVANGDIKLAITYEWGPDSTITGIVHASRKFVPGDTVTLALCYSYLLMGTYFEMVELHTKKLTDTDIANLPYNSHFPITPQTFPELNVFGALPPNFTDVEILVTVLVTGQKDSSQSYLVPMPDMTPEFHASSQTYDDTTHMRIIMENPQAFTAEIGERALNLHLVFLDDMQTNSPTYYKVTAMSRDSNGKINGFIIVPPAGRTFFETDPTPGADEYSGLIKDNKYIVIFTGIAAPMLMEG
jgi:hypothetical protein